MAKYALYVLELEPVEDKHAKWYVGITKNMQQRLYAHRGNSSVTWVFRNRTVDHVVVGEWSKLYARRYEDELTELLMNEYGWQSTRGGSRTDPDRPGVPQRDFTDVPNELLRALADTDHEGLLRLTNDYPVFSYRNSVEDGRVSVGDLLVYEDTAESVEKAHSYLEGTIGAEFDEHDVHEAMLIAGMRNIEDVEEVLRDWSDDGRLDSKQSATSIEE